MANYSLPESAYPPEIQATAARIAATGRIVVQLLVPPETLQEVESRLFLTAVGEMMKDREYSLEPMDTSERF